MVTSAILALFFPLAFIDILPFPLGFEEEFRRIDWGAACGWIDPGIGIAMFTAGISQSVLPQRMKAALENEAR